MANHRFTHYVDSNLTAETAKSDLVGDPVAVAWYTNQKYSQSLVHSHPYYEIIIPVRGGDILYSINGGLISMRVGDMICIPPEVYHSVKYFSTEDSKSERLIVQINAAFWNRTLINSSINPGSWLKEVTVLKSSSVDKWDIRGLFHRLAQTHNIVENDSYRLTVYQTQLVEFYLLVSYEMQTGNYVLNSATNDLVNRTVSYLQEHFTEPDLTVIKLAQVTFSSREYLSRVFKQYTMESIHSYLTGIRLQHFLRELADGTSITSAYALSGFSEYTSFLKSFKQRYNMTPAEYRSRRINKPFVEDTQS